MAKYIIVNGIRVASDFEPETFGRLTTIGPRFTVSSGSDKRIVYQVCQCQCGLVKVVEVDSMKRGLTVSCGCYQKEIAATRTRIHGNAANRSKRRSTEYGTWTCMKYRCLTESNKNYKNYGGRGIKVCDRWLEPDGRGFMNFLEDMGPKPTPDHSLDRIDNNGDYCPENCRWSTQITQSQNTRRNRMLEHEGKIQCVSAWARELDIHPNTLRHRLAMGWSDEKILTTPIAKSRSSKKNES